MTSLPDWLVERAALDEVPAASRARIDHADPQELAMQLAALREANAAELAAHPPGPAVAQIEARVAALARRRRQRRVGRLALALSAAAVIVLVAGRVERTTPASAPEVTRVKGTARLMAFRQLPDGAERLEQDALVRAGDVIQLRYNAGGHPHGLIASIDGAGTVTLHFPLREDAPTTVAPNTVNLPNAYALDDAPGFERFFFITANQPIDVQRTLAQLRAFARRSDSATAPFDLPDGFDGWSLRLRKPTHEGTP